MSIRISSDDVDDLAPSAKLVYLVLDYEGELTQAELIDRTRLHPRTIRYAIDQLDEAGVLEERHYPRDARQSLYSVE